MKIIFFMILSHFMMSGCQTIYYSFWETFGVEKRELLHDNIASVQKQQKETEESFRTALQRLKIQHNAENTKLEKFYAQIKNDYENASQNAEELRSRTKKVEEIADDFFAEWADEIQIINDRQYQRVSREKMNQSKQRYANLSRRMNDVIRSLDPALTRLRDNTLFVKHNLNASTIDVFSKEFKSIETDVEGLLKRIQTAVADAEKFLAEERQASG